MDDFDSWVAGRAPRLKRVAYLLTGNNSDADDLVQDTFVRLLTRGGSFSTIANVDAYARRVMTNLFLTQQKRRGRFAAVRHLLTAPDRVEDSDEAASTSSFTDMLRSLGPRQRAVLVLRHYLDLDDAEIAEVLGCSPSTVRSQASRAVERLRQQTDWSQVAGGGHHGRA